MKTPNSRPLALKILRSEPGLLAVMGVLSYGIARLVYTLFAGETFPFEWSMLRYLPAAFFAASFYALLARFEPQPRPGKRQFYPVLSAEILFSAGLVAYVHFFDPMLWMDDAGFILRYLENFQEGCFFCFNPADGPVFGISSFVYGLAAGLLNMTGLLGPEASLTLLTYTGIFFSGFLLFRIIRKTISHPSLTFFAWLGTVTLSKAYFVTANSGMEAPLHLAICLAAIWFFYHEKSRGMWFFMALAVISKLDAVPLMGVVGIFWLGSKGQKLLPFRWKNKEVQDLVFFGVLPLVVYIGFTFLIFGGPFPQSAYAKVYFHGHPEDSWFPFLDYFTADGYRSASMIIFLVSFAVHHFIVFMQRDREAMLNTLAGWGFLGTLTLYFFYNPGEQMIWYYVLPEILMLLQTVLSLIYFLEKILWQRAFIGLHLLLGALFLITWTHTIREVRWFREYEYVVEGERMMLGEYLAATTTEADSVMTGHGLTAAYTDAYVIDLTGLNSRLATDLELDDMRMVRELHPDWIVMHGWPRYHAIAQEVGYVEDTAFYGITQYKYPSWRVWRKAKTGEFISETLPLDSTRISGEEAGHMADRGWYRAFGHNLSLQLNRADSGASDLKFGIYRKAIPFQVEIRQFSGDSLLSTQKLEIEPYPQKMGPPYHAVSMNIPILPDTSRPFHRRIELIPSEYEEGIEIVDPLLKRPVRKMGE